MTLNDVMAVILRYFTEFGKHAFQHNRVDLWWNLCTSLLYFVVRARCRRKESSRSLSHLPMSYLLKSSCNYKTTVVKGSASLCMLEVRWMEILSKILLNIVKPLRVRSFLFIKRAIKSSASLVLIVAFKAARNVAIPRCCV